MGGRVEGGGGERRGSWDMAVGVLMIRRPPGSTHFPYTTRVRSLLTKSLLFAGERAGAADASAIFRAHDKQTGEIITEMDLPGNQTGLPFTYEHEGKQYIAMFVGGGGIPAELVAYALP